MAIVNHSNENWIEEVRTLQAELGATGSGNNSTSMEKRLESALENLSSYQEQLRAQNEELILARENAESLLKRYSVLFDCSPVGYFIIDKNSAILESNIRGAEMLGYSQSHLIGKPLFLYIDPSLRRELDSHFRAVFRDETVSDEVTFVGPGGKAFPVLINSSPLDGSVGKDARCLTAIFDISERKEVENALLLAKDEAEIANRTKSEFLAIMAHELRTPLNAIIGFSDAIQQQSFGRMSPPKYEEYISHIYSSGVDLLELINNLLDLGKAETGNMEIHDEEIYVHALVNSAVVLVTERANKAGVIIDVEIRDDMPKILADPRLLKQMILNLLTNAIKFTEKGGKITVSAMLDKHQGVSISVSDTGVGIADEDISNVLRRYGQVREKQKMTEEGTGLGLPIVVSMIELHGGRLEIDSEIEQGTTITLRLPPFRTLPA